MTTDATPHDTGYSPDRWAFDDEVTRVFDDMLARSIPQYHVMRALCADVGHRLITPGTDIVDLGCSRGEALAPFVARYGAHNRYVGVEVSTPMMAAAQERFRGYSDAGVVRLFQRDLREFFPPAHASLILSVLTLMFVPVEHRARVVQRAHDALIPGGGFLLVEKVLGDSPWTADVLVEIYHDLKMRNGYTQDEVERKRLALEGVLVPLTGHANEQMLTAAGFHDVQCFWRWGNFAAWVARA